MFGSHLNVEDHLNGHLQLCVKPVSIVAGGAGPQHRVIHSKWTQRTGNQSNQAFKNPNVSEWGFNCYKREISNTFKRQAE